MGGVRSFFIMAQHLLLTLSRDPDEFEAGLERLHLPGLQVVVPRDEKTIRDYITQADILLANPPIAAQWLDQAQNLRWVQSTFAGIDALAAPGLRRDYLLTNVKDVYGPAMAEYVFAFILGLEKELFAFRNAQQEKRWDQKPSRTLEGKTLGVLGTGSIGREIARAGKTFGLRTVGLRRGQGSVEHFDAVYPMQELHTVLTQSDYLVCVLPNTPETVGLLDADAFATARPGSIFLNIGRGNTVDESALTKALDRGQIRTAVLDVMNAEPLPPESPLWGREDVYITPHVSGYIVSDRIFSIFEENYRRFLAGEELLYQVDFTRGY